ncbi:MAG: hypothetical protein ACJ8GW_04675 [Massilia sp.]
MKRKLTLAALLTIGWAAAMALANLLLAPVLGAATVQQLDDSNASYRVLRALITGAPLVSVAITALFVLAFYLLTRSENTPS